jgi:hypothetical protein
MEMHYLTLSSVVGRRDATSVSVNDGRRRRKTIPHVWITVDGARRERGKRDHSPAKLL